MKFDSSTALDLPVHQAKPFASAIWPSLVILLLLSPSLYWIAQDHSVWPWDQAWYGQVSSDLWFTLVNSPAEWLPAMWKAFGSKAPGIAWVGQWFVPIGRAIGSVESGLLLSILAVQFGTLVLTYKIGQELVPDLQGAPLVACLMMASAPLFIALSHQFFAEPLQLFAVTYFYLIAAKSQSWGRIEILAHLLLATSIALSSKVTSPIYCFFPGCFALYTAIRKGRTADDLSTTWNLKASLFAGIALSINVVIWYMKNASAVLDFVKLASSSKLALGYGTNSNILPKLQYWSSAFQKGLAHPGVLLLLIIVLLLALRQRFVNTGGWSIIPSGPLSLLAVAAVAHIGMVLTIFSLSINEEDRYLLPLFPSIVVIFLWCLSLIRIRFLLIAVGIVFVTHWVYVESRALGLGTPDSRISHWVLPLHKSNQAMNELDRIVQLTCTKETADQISVTGVELPWLNYNSISFYASKRRHDTKVPCHNTSLGFAENDPEKAWARLNRITLAYFISLDEAVIPHPPNFLNDVSLPILKRIQADPRFTQVPYHSDFKVVVFRNQS